MATFNLQGSSDEILLGMAVWFKERGETATIKGRSHFQRGWDSAVLACTEYLRRRLSWDEKLALELHKLLTPVNESGEKGRAE